MSVIHHFPLQWVDRVSRKESGQSYNQVQHFERKHLLSLGLGLLKK